MDKRAAKRRACAVAAWWLKSTLEAGSDVVPDLDPDHPDQVRCAEAMEELIMELHLRGGL